MKTASSNKKIREIIILVQEGKLIPRPEFQRRLVWTRDDKNKFIDTILRGYPFPEIYLANGELNLETAQGTQLLVDGLQRVDTIAQYFFGDSSLGLTLIPAYSSLNTDEQEAFLEYDVAVRDLGAISKEEIIEVFKRLNATKYSLLDIEISNAVFAGALKKFAERISLNSFFQQYPIFNAADYRRMGDLRFCLSFILTMITGYFNRDEVFEDLLSRFNDDFPQESELEERIYNVISFIEECGFDNKSRIWRKADLFSFLVELDAVMNTEQISLQPSLVVETLENFFGGIDTKMVEGSLVHTVYYKAAIQATNDKVNRIRRGTIIGSLLESHSIEEIEKELKAEGLG